MPSARGVHKVCVCTHHQNVKLMLEGSIFFKKDPLNLGKEGETTGYRDYLGLLMYESPQPPDWYENNCDKCFNKENRSVKAKLLIFFKEQDLNSIKFYQ